jgi:hypothetical protein
MGNGIMSNFTDFISGGGSASYPTIFLHNSQTWVPPQDGNIMIHVIGAGGSGTGYGTSHSSGAAGGYCKKNSLAVTTSGSFTVVVGAGGASVIGVQSAGAAGGTTSVAGTGLGSTLTATGGNGGAVGSGTAFTTGGVGSNGDFNSNGGRGKYQGGGGAVGLTGTGADGANCGTEVRSYGGNCDIVGDFYSSSFGQLSGSLGGYTSYMNAQTSTGDGKNIAGPLGGSAGMFVNDQFLIAPAHATIGGGGGFCRQPTYASIFSGRGGEGCVVIQYIP